MGSMIDPLVISYSQKRAYQTVVPGQLEMINALNSMLPKCGWTVKEAIKATAVINYPLGYPIVDPTPITPKRLVGCGSGFLTIGDLNITIYNPFTETPIPGSPCAFAALGATAADGLGNLCNLINASTSFTATPVPLGGDAFQVQLEADLGGAEGNFVFIGTDGRWAEASLPTAGGGYNFESANGAAVYQVAVTAIHSPFGDLAFDFLLNGNRPTQRYQLDLVSNPTHGVIDYQIACNGYGFCIFQDPVVGEPFRSVALFCAAPYRPPATDPLISKYEIFDAGAYAVCVAGVTANRNSLVWSTGCTTALDGNAVTFSNSGGIPRVLAMRAPQADALLTQYGAPLVIGAYIIFGTGPASSANVIGKLYDCAVVHQAVDGIMLIQSQRFLPIAIASGAGGGTPATLLMCIPAAAEGSKGTANFLGNQVIRTSGPPWTPDMVGGPITIGGIPYTVILFRADDNIQVNVDTVIQSGLNWSIP